MSYDKDTSPPIKSSAIPSANAAAHGKLGGALLPLKTENNGNEKPPIVWPTALLLSITPIAALITIPWYQWAVGFEWHHWLAFLVFAALNGMSITAGYHRLWAHNTYRAHWLMRLGLALFGASAFQNSILVWASQHRRHHRHVDDENHDPYSAKKGLWFSHIGWMLRHYPNGQDDFSNAKDLQRDKIVMWQHRHYYSIALVMNLFPPLLLGFLTGDYLAYILLMGVLRLVYSHHTTFFINSLAHFWGRRPYTAENTARDNGILALLTYGEGYHNYHHLFQNDYRNGVRWYQFDPTKWLIGACSWMGLAKDLKRTPQFKIRQAMVMRQLEEAKSRLSNGAAAIKLQATLGAQGYEQWKRRLEEQIDSEYQHMTRLLEEWSKTQQAWVAAKRAKLVTASQSVQGSLKIAELADIPNVKQLKIKMKTLEKEIKDQYQRVCGFNMAMA